MNFDGLVSEGKFSSVEDAIAYEYGYFLEATGKLAIINSDSELIKKQSLRTPAKIKEVSKKDLEKYEISEKGTVFKIKGKTYKFNFLLPVRAVSGIIVLSIPFIPKLPKPSGSPARKSSMSA